MKNAERLCSARALPETESVSPGRIELNYEIRLKQNDSAFVNALDKIPGVSQAVLVSYNGDYMG